MYSIQEKRRFGPVFALAVLVALSAGHASARDITNLLNDSHAVYTVPSLSVPNLLEWYEDPVFETQVMRVTDGPDQVPLYSKTPPWNADESLLIVYQPGGYHRLYNGRTFSYVGLLDWAWGGNTYSPADLEEFKWDPVDPELAIYPTSPNNNPYTPSVVRKNVTTGETTVLHQFPEYEPWSFKFFGEGNATYDGTKAAFIGTKVSDGQKEVVVYDIENDIVISRGGISGTIDWASISPLGNYVAVMADDGTYVYDVNMNHLYTLSNSPEHSDMGIDSSGNEVLVTFTFTSILERLYMVRLSDGTLTSLLGRDDAYDEWYWTGTHVSCRNSALPGWAYLSTVTGHGSTYPLYREVYRVRLDGSQYVERICHHHSAAGTYWGEPHVAVNYDGTRMIFGSDWDPVGTGIDTYVCDITEGGPEAVDDPAGRNVSVSDLLSFPNPYSPGKAVRYRIADTSAYGVSAVEISIADAFGRRVRTMPKTLATAGDHTFFWDGRDNAGRALPAGMYYCTMKVSGSGRTRRLALVR